MKVKIAVYGTLMEGFRNYNTYLKKRVTKVEYGTTKGKLFHLKDINCPALIDGDEDIKIEIMMIEGDLENIIKELNSIEGYISENNIDNIYNRVLREVYNATLEKTENLYIYEYNMKNKNVSTDNMIYISSGSWRDYMKDKKDI